MGYDLLDDLGVKIPALSVAPAPASTPSTPSTFKIMKPSSRADSTGSSRASSVSTIPPSQPSLGRRAVSTGRETTVASYQPSRARSVGHHGSTILTSVPCDPASVPRGPRDKVVHENDKTILIRQSARGGVEEFELYESGVPSNLACNRMASQRKHEALEREKSRERAALDAAMQREAAELQAERERTAERKQQQQHEFRDWQQRHSEIARQRREKEAEADAASRNFTDHLHAHVGEEEKRRAAARSQLAWREELQKVIEQRAKKRDQESARNAAGGQSRFELSTGLVVTAEEKQARRAALRQAWEDQQHARAEQAKRDRDRDAAIRERTEREIRRAAEEAAEERYRKRESQREVYESTKRSMVERAQRAKEERARREANERRSIEEQLRVATLHETQQVEAARRSKEVCREALLSQIRSHAKRSTSVPPPPSLPPDRKVLYRCPVTHQLLPPENFNLGHMRTRGTLSRYDS